MASKFCFATHLLQTVVNALIPVTDRSLVGSFFIRNKILRIAYTPIKEQMPDDVVYNELNTQGENS